MSDIIQRRKLYQHVAERLEELILSGTYEVGDSLPSERELMERFGVGRPAIREALLALEHAGLIATGSGEKARVVRPTAALLVAGLDPAVRHWLGDPDGVRHMQGARMLLETGLARLAAGSATPDDLGRLREALRANEAARADPAVFERTDVAFHYVLAELAANPIFTALHNAMIGWLTEQRHMSLRVEGAAERAAHSHRLIFEAVVARDGDKAADEMRRHLDEVAHLYWRAQEAAG